MAIHSDLPGIEVTIVSDGKPLKEYDTENDKTKHDNKTAVLHQEAWTVTKYVECVSQSTFDIKLKVQEPYKLGCGTLSFEVKVDGNLIVSQLMFKRQYVKNHWSHTVQGPEFDYAHGTVYQTMKFVRLDITEEKLSKSIIDQHINKMSPVGSVTVTIHRRKTSKRCGSTSSSFQEKDYSSKVHTKSVMKDTKSHGIVLGLAKPATPSKTWKTTLLGSADFPLAKFVFKYRDFKAFQTLCIIPRFPSPSSSPEPVMSKRVQAPVVDLENVTSEQKSQLSTFLQSFGGIGNLTQGTTIKRELKSEEADPPRKKLKTASKRESIEDESSGGLRMKTVTTVKKIPFMDLTEGSDEE